MCMGGVWVRKIWAPPLPSCSGGNWTGKFFWLGFFFESFFYGGIFLDGEPIAENVASYVEEKKSTEVTHVESWQSIVET